MAKTKTDDEKIFGNVSLGWFGDAEPEFEDDEPEIIRLESNDIPEEEDEPEDVPDEYQGVSKADIVRQLKELQSKADSSQALKEGLEGLSSKLQQQPANYQQLVPQQQPGESDKAFRERFNEEVFKEDPYAIMNEFMQRTLGPLQANVGQNLVQTRKYMYKTGEETKDIYKQYEGEIEQFIKGLAPNVQTNPNVVDYAFSEVRKKHEKDIIEQEVERRVKELMSKNKPSEEDNQEQQQSSSKKSFRIEGSGGATNVSRKKSDRIFVTPEIRKRAKILGISDEKVARFVKENGRLP